MLKYAIGWSIGIINLAATFYLHRKTKSSQIAQLAEQWTVNPSVVGSSPTLGAMKNNNNNQFGHVHNVHNITYQKDNINFQQTIKRIQKVSNLQVELDAYKKLTDEMVYLFDRLASDQNSIHTWFEVKTVLDKYESIKDGQSNR